MIINIALLFKSGGLILLTLLLFSQCVSVETFLNQRPLQDLQMVCPIFSVNQYKGI